MTDINKHKGRSGWRLKNLLDKDVEGADVIFTNHSRSDKKKPVPSEPISGEVAKQRLQIRQRGTDGTPQLLPRLVLGATDGQRRSGVYHQNIRLR